jgi:catechol-2,3-dioxygenase
MGVNAARGLPGDGVPVTGVSELVLEVVDLDRAVEFYAGVLGLPVVEQWKERETVWLMAGRQTRIGLWRPQVGLAGGRGGVHVHYALDVDENGLDTIIDRLRSHGYEPQIVEFTDDNRGRAAYVDDPDGNVVEFWDWKVAEHLDSPIPDR